MRTRHFLCAATMLGLAAAPAAASTLLAGTNGVSFTQFDQSTAGALLASKSVTGQSLTFAGTANLAVYRNTAGTLDFYYQFSRSGAGTMGDDSVETITGGNFGSFLVNAMFTDADPDGNGIFQASTNPGAPATAQRSPSGGVVGVDFSPQNVLADTETSATYIFRTNAHNYAPGTFGVIDGSTLQGIGYQPVSGAVPETSTWAMFLLGFGAAGHALRSSRKLRVARS